MLHSSSDFFKSKSILAPLTKGGNLPFRRLCVAFGAEVTVSEMAYARFIAKGDKRERALLRKHETEYCFGVQLAVIDPKEAIAASKAAIEKGAQFIDINCGCPVEDTTRRGLGAAVLRKPNVLAKLVSELSQSIDVPVTVKIRLGWSERDLNYLKVAKLMEDSGARALTVHGRTREQRYSKSADWEKIKEVTDSITIPVIGNGDILTYYEANHRKSSTNVASLMIGRGALIKPRIFQELKEQRTLNPTPLEELEVYFRLARYMKEHFGDDELGIKRSMNFLPWHFNFFHRYQYLPSEEFLDRSLSHPLIQSRFNSPTSDNPLENILRRSDEETHSFIAKALLSSDSVTNVAQLLECYHRDLPSLGDSVAHISDDQLEGV